MMGGFLGKIFGSSKNAEKVISTAADGIFKGLDKIVYTEEEKADAMKKGAEYFLEFMKITNEENGLRSVARRGIAWSVVLINEFAFVVACILALMGETTAVAAIIDLVVAFNLGWAFVAVIVFYFGVQFFRTKK